jgi:uncharacterized protein (TIGR00255 family)
MLRSMTGFGAAGGLVEGVEYAVEMRSVNSRYFKASVKLPEALSWAEADIEHLLRASLSRGSIVAAIRVKLPDDQAACRVNVAALTRYIDQLRELKFEANPTIRIDLGAMLQLPGVCEPPPVEELLSRTKGGLMALIEKALKLLVEMRTTEGRAVRGELMAHCDTIVRNLLTVEKHAPQVVLDYHQRLTDRVRDLTAGGNVQIDQEQLAREVAIFAERCDIAEEISRLRGHVEQFRESADSPDPAGRKMDFIAQEMLREANTISSKANDASIARAVVEIKTAIDRIKEQVQNIE